MFCSATSGFRTAVVSTEWIDAHYGGVRPDGTTDLQTRIRECIREYVQNRGTLYAGTGEPNGSGDSEAGVGLYRSTDAGKSWRLVTGSTAPTAPCASGSGMCPVATGRSVAAISVDPADPGLRTGNERVESDRLVAAVPRAVVGPAG